MPKKAGMEAWKKKRRKDVTDRLLQINPSLAREAARCWTRTSRSGTSGAGWQQEKTHPGRDGNKRKISSPTRINVV